MKLGKIDFSKMKKVTIIEISTILLAIIALLIYLTPNFIHKQEALKLAKIKADGAIFTAKILEEFAKDKTIKASDVAQKVTDELNKTSVNPFDKKLQAYTFEKNCKNCNSVEYDDSASMVILTTLDKNGTLLNRTVIKPPSFVTYSKEN